MKVLVTGANGFLGSWVTRRLVEEGLDVVILRRVKSDLSDILDIKAPHVIGDVVNYDSLVGHLDDVDTVFHLAGLVAYTPAKRAAMIKVNVGGTENVVRACLEKKVRRLVHLSSVVSIGSSFDGKVPLTENSEYNIGHLNLGYFQTKHDGEEIVKNAVRTRGLNAVILNPSTIYGRGDAKKGSRNTQIKVAQGRFPVYTSGGVNVVHVQDVVEGILRAWKVGISGERYILSGENVTIRNLFQRIAREAGVEPPKFLLPKGLVHTLGRVGDWLEKHNRKAPINSENAWSSTLFHWFENEKAKSKLGVTFRPAQEAIAESVAYMKEKGIVRSK